MPLLGGVAAAPGRRWVPIGFRGRGAPGSGYNETNSANSSFQDVTSWTSPSGFAVEAVRLGYAAFDVTTAGEIDRAVTVTGAASIEIGGTIYPAKFGGHRQLLVEPMHDFVLSDPINVALPAGTAFFVRTWGAVSGGTSWWLADYASPATGSTFLTGEGNARGSGLADHTLTTTTPGNSGGGFWPPAVIFGLVSVPTAAVLIIGDSIVAGTGDGADGYGRMGYAQRSLGNALPWLSLARGSTTAAEAVAAGNGRGFYAATPEGSFTDVLLALGRNDIFSGAGASAVVQSLQQLAAPYQAAGLRVWAVTCPPSTSSSDSFATATNQAFGGNSSTLSAAAAAGATSLTVASTSNFYPGEVISAVGLVGNALPVAIASLPSGTVANLTTPLPAGLASGVSVVASYTEWQRNLYNATLRGSWQTLGFAGLIDIASVVEDPANVGKWRTNGGAWTADGVHPSAIGHQAIVSAGLVSPRLFAV